VSTPRTAGRARLGARVYSPAQIRIMGAALDLFATHGVSGTSLQMIADALGVTKAAVYHKFKAKDDIVLAVTEAELGKLEDALAAAHAQHDAVEARKMLLQRVIDLSVERRGFIRVMQNDPVVVRLLGEHEPFRAFMSELYATLLDQGDEIEARISAAFVTAAIASTTVSPLVEDIDTETLRAKMTELTERMLRLAPLKGTPTRDQPNGSPSS
jgi:AcrR family transcriptional regulator